MLRYTQALESALLLTSGMLSRKMKTNARIHRTTSDTFGNNVALRYNNRVCTPSRGMILAPFSAVQRALVALGCMQSNEANLP
jgi:hypothetical protein